MRWGWRAYLNIDGRMPVHVHIICQVCDIEVKFDQVYTYCT